jgi:hypothetical protein
MTLTSESATRIQEYLDSHKECKTERVQRLEIAGALEDRPVYRIPTSLLYYNIKNGRFAAEYLMLKSRLCRDLDSNRREDVEEIEKLLLKDRGATKILKEDLQKVGGQREPGIITYDGYVINGNRRMAVYAELAKETGDERWRYIEVSILPPGTDERTLWRIEAGLQFSRGERLDYNKINVLLKFREGQQAGLTLDNIASSLYGGYTATEINEELKRLELIDRFLDYISAPGQYKRVEDKHEHFVELQKFIDQQKRRGQDDEDTLKAIMYAFELIRVGYPHRKLRDLNGVMNNSGAKASFLEAADKATVVETGSNGEVNGNSGAVNIALTPIVQAFEGSVDIVQANGEKSRPIILLRRALTNLENVDINLIKANDSELETMLQRMAVIIESIRGRLQKIR